MRLIDDFLLLFQWEASPVKHSWVNHLVLSLFPSHSIVDIALLAVNAVGKDEREKKERDQRRKRKWEWMNLLAFKLTIGTGSYQWIQWTGEKREGRRTKRRRRRRKKEKGGEVKDHCNEQMDFRTIDRSCIGTFARRHGSEMVRYFANKSTNGASYSAILSSLSFHSFAPATARSLVFSFHLWMQRTRQINETRRLFFNLISLDVTFSRSFILFLFLLPLLKWLQSKLINFTTITQTTVTIYSKSSHFQLMKCTHKIDFFLLYFLFYQL